MSASSIRDMLMKKEADDKTFIENHADLATAWRREYEEAAGTGNFLKSLNNYPETDKSAVDLFKWFLPLSWKNGCQNGVQGFVHPMTVFTETNALSLRKRAYKKARYIFQFTNEKKLFPEVHNETQFCEVIYGQRKGRTCTAIMNIFHPTTIDESFASDGDSVVEGIKALFRNWNLKGAPGSNHPFEQHGNPFICSNIRQRPEAPILLNIHCQSLLSILEKFGACSLRLNSISDELTISSMWHETGARLDGTIKEFPNHRTQAPNEYSKLILNGPHLSVGSPLFKNAFCKNVQPTRRGHLLILKQSLIISFHDRNTNEGDISDEDYNNRQVGCKWDPVTISIKTNDNNEEQTLEFPRPFDQHWRSAYRGMIGRTVREV